MTGRAIALEIVTPDGTALREAGLDVVVVRRREPHFDPGSEIAVFPRHAPMLVRVPVTPVRFSRAGQTVHLAVGGGFAQISNDRVLIVTPRCVRIDPAVREPAAAAKALCDRWCAEALGTIGALAGYP